MIPIRRALQPTCCAVQIFVGLVVALCQGCDNESHSIPQREDEIRFSEPRYAVGEGDGHLSVTVMRDGTSDSCSAWVLPADSSATCDQDYHVEARLLCFPPGCAQAEFSLEILQDSIPEPSEYLWLAIARPSPGLSLGNPAAALVVIHDDDSYVTGDSVRFPVSLGCTWSYDVVEMATGPGFYYWGTRVRRDSINADVDFNGDTYHHMTFDRRPGHANEMLLRQVGSRLLFVVPTDTSAVSPGDLLEGLAATLPWTLADFTAESDTSYVLFTATDPEIFGDVSGVRHSIAYGRRADVVVPYGTFYNVFVVTYSIRSWCLNGICDDQWTITLYIADGYGIVKEEGHHDTPEWWSYEPLYRTWEAQLTDFHHPPE